MSWCWHVFADFKGSFLYLLDLNACFLPQIRKFSAIICSYKPSAPFTVSSSGTPMIQILFHFMESLSSLILPSWSSNFLSLFFFSFIIFHNFIIYSFLCFFHPVTVSSLFCISFTVFLNSLWLFLRSLISSAIDSLLSSMPFSSPAISLMTVILSS